MGGSSLLDAGCQALAGVPAPALAAAALALGVLLAWRAWGQLALLRPPLPPAQPTRGDPADPLVLCDFPLAKSGNIAASFSPFVGKVHTALRLAGLTYTVERTAPPSAPRGTLPFIRHGPHTVADSACILRYLRATYPDNAKLQALFTYATPQEQGVAVAVQALLDNRLFWVGFIRSRWLDPAGFQRNMRSFGASLHDATGLPWAGVWVLMTYLRKRYWTQMAEQGLGKLAAAEQQQVLEEAVEALAGLLGDKPYFTGSHPRAVDAAAFAFLDLALNDGIVLPLRELVAHHACLVNFVARMRAACFPELGE